MSGFSFRNLFHKREKVEQDDTGLFGIENLLDLRARMAACGLQLEEIDALIKSRRGSSIPRNGNAAIASAIHTFLSPVLKLKRISDARISIRYDDNELAFISADFGDGSVPVYVKPEEDEEDSSDKGGIVSGHDRSRYEINGEGSYNKRQLAQRILELYVEEFPDDEPEAVRDIFLSLGVHIPHLVELPEEFELRRSQSRDSGKTVRATLVSWPKGDLYITTQWRVENITEFIERVNERTWGIYANKIE